MNNPLYNVYKNMVYVIITTYGIHLFINDEATLYIACYFYWH